MTRESGKELFRRSSTRSTIVQIVRLAKHLVYYCLARELRQALAEGQNQNRLVRTADLQAIGKLLATFDGTGVFKTWQQQVQMVIQLNNLEEKDIKLLICSKLSGAVEK